MKKCSSEMHQFELADPVGTPSLTFELRKSCLGQFSRQNTISPEVKFQNLSDISFHIVSTTRQTEENRQSVNP